MPGWITRLDWCSIREVSSAEGVDPYLVAAMIMVESGGNYYAARYEPNYKYLYKVQEFATLNKITYFTEEVLQKTSFGALQVLGANCREMGYNKDLTRLPGLLGLVYGCRFLNHLQKRYHIQDDAIASYNAGSPIKTLSGEYKNQAYVDKVSGFLLELSKLR